LSFGRLVLDARIAAGLTQEALAARAGLSARGIQNLEHDLRRPYPDTLARLVRALDLAGEARARFEEAGRSPPRPSPAAGREADTAPRHNLPAQLTSLVGRDQELEELGRTLERARLLTLTGVGDRYAVASQLEALGLCAERAGQDTEAQAWWEEALALFGELGDRMGLATDHTYLGTLACRRGDLARAREHLAASLAITRQTGGDEWIAQALGGLAAVAAALGQAARALRLAGAGARLHALGGGGPEPAGPDEIERPLARARAALDAATADAAWGEGRAMTTDEAIAYALADDPA